MAAPPRLDWQTLTGSRSSQFFVKHTRLAVAFYMSHRFAIYKMRGPRNADGSFDDYYGIADAHTVTDEDLREGRRAQICYRTPTLDLAQAIAFCDNCA